MSSWVKVTRGQPQKPVVNKKKPSGIPRLLDINPYKPSQKISFSELYPRDVEDQNSFEELFGKKHNYSTGPEEYCERYQFSENSTQYNSDDRREKLYLKFYQQIQDEYHKERPSDCTIVAISKEQMEYATAIGHRLQDHGLVVEMIYLTTETGLTRALQEVKNDGSPFCILVEQSNVALSSCTAIILHDSIKSFEEADTTEQANPAFDSHTNSKTHLLEKPPPLLPTPARNSFGGMAKPSLLGDRPSAGIGLLSNQGFKNIELDDAANSIYKTLPSVSSDALAKPPPLLPTPVRTPLMSVGKPPLLSERSSGGLLPTPGLSAPQGKPPPLLAMPTKRPPLLGYPQISPAKRPLLGEKPGLLPTPALSGNNTSHLWPVKPKPLLQ
ncbi:nuclear receptor coactivator 5-like isoform X5 [Rana temporaria]|uniref:nuclear receptor coactivator 5-like isoform X5 n=1 Tax=Rana temporaria TaxID=8407 RepID=UPI001AAD11B9|nr:nuclear receptor coactivator 5-like isoform X5 [Rana temporaria]